MSNKHIFKNVRKDQYGETTFQLEMQSDKEFLYDLISDLTDYLRGCGFVFDGHLAIVEDNDGESRDIKKKKRKKAAAAKQA